MPVVLTGEGRALSRLQAMNQKHDYWVFVIEFRADAVDFQRFNT